MSRAGLGIAQLGLGWAWADKNELWAWAGPKQMFTVWPGWASASGNIFGPGLGATFRPMQGPKLYKYSRQSGVSLSTHTNIAVNPDLAPSPTCCHRRNPDSANPVNPGEVIVHGSQRCVISSLFVQKYNRVLNWRTNLLPNFSGLKVIHLCSHYRIPYCDPNCLHISMFLGGENVFTWRNAFYVEKIHLRKKMFSPRMKIIQPKIIQN